MRIWIRRRLRPIRFCSSRSARIAAPGRPPSRIRARLHSCCVWEVPSAIGLPWKRWKLRGWRWGCQVRRAATFHASPGVPPSGMLIRFPLHPPVHGDLDSRARPEALAHARDRCAREGARRERRRCHQPRRRRARLRHSKAVVEAAHEAALAGKTKYTAVAGIPELRAAIASQLSKTHGLAVDPAQVVVTNGAKQALFNALRRS